MKTILSLTISILLLCSIAYGQVPTSNLTKAYLFSSGDLQNSVNPGVNDLVKTGSASSLTTANNSFPDDAISLNGDYLNAGTATGNTNMAASFWIKTTTNDANNRYIFSQFTGANGYGVKCYLNNGKIVFGGSYIEGSTVSAFNSIASTVNVADGSWHHVTVIAKKQSYTVAGGIIYTYFGYYIYIDGAADGVTANADSYVTKSLLNNTTPLMIGIDNDLAEMQYEDEIDDFRFYERDLSLTEIQNLKADNEPRTILYVDKSATGLNDGSSWANAYVDLQSALANFVAQDEIWVAAGTYTPHASDRKATFDLPDKALLYGGFDGSETLRSQRDPKTNVTILSGDLSANDNATITDTEATRQDNSYHVVSIRGNAQNVVVDGFTISGGNANGTDDTSCATSASNQYYDSRGAAVYANPYALNDNVTALIQNCVLENNTSSSVAVYYSFTPCGITSTITDVDFVSCIVRDNFSNALPPFVFTGSSQYGIYSRGSITNSLFHDNVSLAGASCIYLGTSNGTNTANGAIGNTSGIQVDVINSTFSNNTGVNGNAFTMIRASNTNIKNSIIYGNGSASPFLITTSGSTVSNSIVQGGQQGGSNVDPLFVDSNNDDYSVDCTSPAIDAGNSAGLLSIFNYINDLGGNNRIVGTLDMGCYEFASSFSTPTALTSITLALDASGAATLATDDVKINFPTTSLCGFPIVYSLDQSSFTCADAGTSSVTLTGDDGNGYNWTETISVTIEDNIIPTATGQDIIVAVDANTGYVNITPAQVDNGSTDNCSGSLILSLSKTQFRCEDTGDNAVTLTVEDPAGNVATADVTVTVTSSVVDETVTATNTNFCPDGSQGATISTGSSLVGYNYTLRNSENNSVVVGPIAGTGSGLDFVTGNLSATTTFNILQEKVRSTTQSALDFDGVDDYVNFGSDNRGITTAITIGAWIKTSASGSTQFLAAKYDGTTYGYYLYLDANGKAGIAGRDGTGGASGSRTSGVSSTAANDNEWHYIVGSVNISTGKWSIYVDGVLENSATLSTGSTLASTASFTLGAYSTIYSTGIFDQVTIWDTELDASTIQTYMNTCLTGSESNIVGHFIFEDGTGTWLTDHSSTAISGALTNMDGNTDWIQILSPSCGEKVCDFQMTTEITVGDDVAPTVATQDISIQLDASGSTTVTTDMIDNGSSDNCSGALTMSLSQTEFTCSDTGVNTVTLTVEDANGNQGTATANVTITSAINDETVTATDTEICSSGSSTTVTTGSSVSDVLYYLRNSANDAIVDGPIQGTGSGLSFNTGSINATTTYHVYAETQGNYALDFDGVDDKISLGTNGRSIVGAVTIAAWIKTSSSGSIQSIASKYDGATGPALLMNASGQVTIDGRDGTGYKSSGYSTAAVNDNVWHYVVGMINVTTGQWKIYVDGVLESSASNGAGTTLANATDFSIGSLGSTNFFSGQIDQVTVWNTEVPLATIIANMSDCLTGSEAGVVGHFKMDEGSGSTIADLSSSALDGTLSMDPANDWIEITGPTCTQTACGFQMSSEVTVSLDNVVPTATAQDVTVQLDANGSATITAGDINIGSSDNCTAAGNLVLSLDKTAFTCADIGANTITLTVEDLAGNTGTATATVTVVDGILPTVVTQNITVALDAAGNASITSAEVNNGSSDNCTAAGNLILSLDKIAFTCADLGANTVTLTVEDESGNQNTATATVTIEDTAAPTAIANDITVSLDASGNATVDPSALDNGSSDVCSSNLNFSLSQSTFSCSDVGANSVTFTVTDDSGNSSTATITITVVDDILPVAVAQDITVRLDVNNSAVIAASDVDNSSSDNCSVILSLDIDTFDETNLGANIVTLTAADLSGNSSSATATVTVEEYKQDQTITFDVIADKTYGDASFDLTATASSGLSITYAVISGPASLTGSTLSITGIGTVIVEASQAGNADFISATAQRTFTVQQATLSATAENQFIVYGDAIPTLTIQYTGFVNGENSLNLTEEPIISTTATNASDAGIYPIVLTGGAADNYAIVLTDGELTIDKADQSITLEAINDMRPTDGPFDVVASASSGLEITYEVTGPATISGTTITLDGTVGTVTVTVSQAGNVNYNAAVSMSVSFEVSEVLGAGDDLENSVRIYPNPVTEFVIIETDKPVRLNLFSLNGVLVKSFDKVRGQISMSDLRSGHYLMEIVSENERFVRKIVKSK